MIVKMNNEITKFLIGTGPTKVMIALHRSKSSIPPSVSDIAKSVNITYSHVVKITENLKHAELIKIVKIGRRNNVSLTDEGKEVSKLLSKVFDRLENIDDTHNTKS